ncbi:hypothetical protein Tco_0892402 [Tanacetum coccineum]|uniref:Uncharacterized protein n=1 Tax=Tanacetum coccineum TaxID=301880 RepID=A0ABQ5C5S5_9ASTR
MAYPLPSDTAYLIFCPIQRIHPNRLIWRITSIGYGPDFNLLSDQEYSEEEEAEAMAEVEVANIPCDSKVNDDSEHAANDDIGFDSSDIKGDDEVELTDEESSEDENEITKVFRIDTNIFDYETPLCSAFNEFNYLLKVDPDLLTKDIVGFKTYEDYKDDWIYEWNKDVPWVYDKPWLDNGI